MHYLDNIHQVAIWSKWSICSGFFKLTSCHLDNIYPSCYLDNIAALDENCPSLRSVETQYSNTAVGDSLLHLSMGLGNNRVYQMICNKQSLARVSFRIFVKGGGGGGQMRQFQS